jgi:hypothetical protein
MGRRGNKGAKVCAGGLQVSIPASGGVHGGDGSVRGDDESGRHEQAKHKRDHGQRRAAVATVTQGAP